MRILAKGNMLHKKVWGVLCLWLGTLSCVRGETAMGLVAHSKEGTSGGTVSLSRLVRAMEKLRAGELISLVTLGGSITTGYAAREPANEGWAGLVQQWWEQKARETGGNILFHNAGLSGTDSAWATVRLKDHVLIHDPDVVFVEFAVNDQWLDAKVRRRSYEGLLRGLLSGSDRAVLLLFLNEKSHPERGLGAEQAELGTYYGLPMLRWADWVNPEEWGRFFTGSETIHPNNEGHENIAGGIISFLEEVWRSTVQRESNRTDSEEPKTLPPLLYTDEFQYVEWIHSKNAGALEQRGWLVGSDEHPEWFRRGGVMPQGWKTADKDAHLSIRVRAKSVGVLFSESDQYRNAQAWVEYPDGKAGQKVSLDCFVSYRKGYFGWAYRELVQGTEIQDYVVHLVVKKSRPVDDGKWVTINGFVVTGVNYE